MTSEIKKAVIPVAGNGTRFLPLSKVVPKEFFPLGEKPLIHWVVEELKLSGIEEIVFVVGKNNKKLIVDYFKRSLRMEKFLEERGKKELIESLRTIDKLAQGLSFSCNTVLGRVPSNFPYTESYLSKYAKFSGSPKSLIATTSSSL